VKNGYTRVGGVWKQFFVNLAVSLAGTQLEHNQTRLNLDCFAGVTIHSNGNEYAVGNDGDIDAHNLGPWLDGGETSQVWVRCSVNSGSLGGSSATGVWLATTTTRTWQIIDTTDNATPVTAQITVELAFDSAGTIIADSETYNLSADVA
jgi:hypothetical protein